METSLGKADKQLRVIIDQVIEQTKTILTKYDNVSLKYDTTDTLSIKIAVRLSIKEKIPLWYYVNDADIRSFYFILDYVDNDFIILLDLHSAYLPMKYFERLNDIFTRLKDCFNNHKEEILKIVKEK